MAIINYIYALGAEPGEIIQADNYERVQKAIRNAAEAGHGVIPWGGGTGQTYGYLPERADMLLDLSGMNRVLAHEPGDLTVTVEAGVTLDAVQHTLAERNQFLPIDAPHEKNATLGGIIATNAWGAGRTGYGTVRDWLLGLTVVDAQGRLVKGGGKVVKNVTGYDTPKLHVGALGTLGVIVEATFKVAPRPEHARPLLFVLPESADENTSAFFTRLLRETTPTFAVLQDEAGSRLFALLYAGYEAVVEHEADHAARLARDFGAEAVSALPFGASHPLGAGDAPHDTPLIAQLAGRPAHAYLQHESLHRLLGNVARRLMTHPATGHMTVFLSSDADAEGVARQMVQWAQETQTPLTFLHAPSVLRKRDAGFALWTPLPPALPLMQKLKQTLDESNTLNPGRFFLPPPAPPSSERERGV